MENFYVQDMNPIKLIYRIDLSYKADIMSITKTINPLTKELSQMSWVIEYQPIPGVARCPFTLSFKSDAPPEEADEYNAEHVEEEVESSEELPRES